MSKELPRERFLKLTSVIGDFHFRNEVLDHDALQRATIQQLETQLKYARHEAVRAFVHGEDTLCLVCGAKEPCELKDDPASPCTFEPTPIELLRKVRELAGEKQQLEAKLAELQGEA